MLEQANETMASHLRQRTNALLAQVLFTSSNLMNNSFSLSDK
jgi:dipeptidase